MEEQEKFDRIQIEADRLKDSIFYQRCHLDYRGRIYLSKSTISYQGDDLERSLIEFGEGVPLDDVFVPCLDETNSYPISEGFKWLLLHAATLYEIPFDKSQLLSSTITDNEDEAEEVASSISLQRSFDGSSPITYQRIEVALKHLDQWVAYGTNPVETYPEWTRNSEGDLDDPLQFIRVCMELRNILEHENKQIVKKKNKCSDKWTPNAVRSNLKEELIQSELDQDGRGVQEIMAKHLNLPTPFV